MARRARIEYPGAFYHVISRGNQRQKIFFDDRDRKKYLELLFGLGEAYGFRLHGYVLMSNHVHLLMEAGAVPLSRFMQRLGSGYTQYFNRRRGLVGHLFQGRYRAILCDKASYLLELTRYLHLNPVRAKVVKEPGAYVWSSYRAYVREKGEQEGLETAEVLGQFSRRVIEAKRLYRRFVLEGLGEGHKEEYYELLDGRILGGQEFAERIKARAGEKGRLRIKVKPGDFLERVCVALGKAKESVVGAAKDRDRVRARELICYLGRSCTELSVNSLAQTLKVDPTCVSRSVSRVESRLAKDMQLRRSVEGLMAGLANSKYQA